MLYQALVLANEAGAKAAADIARLHRERRNEKEDNV